MFLIFCDKMEPKNEAFMVASVSSHSSTKSILKKDPKPSFNISALFWRVLGYPSQIEKTPKINSTKKVQFNMLSIIPQVSSGDSLSEL